MHVYVFVSSCSFRISKKAKTKLMFIFSLALVSFALFIHCSFYSVYHYLVGVTYSPEPVDHLDLLVDVHHEEDEEEHGKDQLEDGHGGEALIHGRSIAADDDKAEKLRVIRERKEGGGG